MTGNMQMMMKFRDLQVAEDFSKMAELGYLDKEFTMYGAAFGEDGRRRYIVTGDLDKLYDFDSACTRNADLPDAALDADQGLSCALRL